MVTKKRAIGDVGEEIACGYLVNSGYKIIERNYGTSFGEIDIISKSPDKTLVFFEVKTKSNEKNSGKSGLASYPQFRQGVSETFDSFMPEDQITPSKLEKFKRICEWYANKNPKIIYEKKGYRLDVIAIVLEPTLTIRHYKNIY